MNGTQTHNAFFQRNLPIDIFSRTHDTISYISPERAQAAMNNVPVPVGMFMNMSHVPPRFFNQHQQTSQTRHGQRTRRGGGGGMNMRGKGNDSKYFNNNIFL